MWLICFYFSKALDYNSILNKELNGLLMKVKKSFSQTLRINNFFSSKGLTNTSDSIAKIKTVRNDGSESFSCSLLQYWKLRTGDLRISTIGSNLLDQSETHTIGNFFTVTRADLTFKGQLSLF